MSVRICSITLLIYLSFVRTHNEHAAKIVRIAESEYKNYGINLYYLISNVISLYDLFPSM